MFTVITTIQEPTDCVRKFADTLEASGSRLIAVGDKKGPVRFDAPATDFLSLADQLKTPFSLAQVLPTGTYARKSIGYLHAMSLGAECIYETDDDNAPLSHWALRSCTAEARQTAGGQWLNAYKFFTEEIIWPRGFPLSHINDPVEEPTGPAVSVNAPIQQGLVDDSPDVDAVWRLTMDREIQFERRPSICLSSGTYCPFNSQSTWWWPEAYPLMYLPSTTSFRMTDIWRGLIAQRCLWEMGRQMVFHAAEARQERNVHDLMVDFRDEVPGYLGNEEIARQLDSLSLVGEAEAVAENLLTCYEHLTRAGFFSKEEPARVKAWVSDLQSL